MTKVQDTLFEKSCPPSGDINPQWKSLQDVFGCLVNAALDVAPAFAESFFNCINGSGPPADDQYQPGNRERCPSSQTPTDIPGTPTPES